jgi:hypothetical protein
MFFKKLPQSVDSTMDEEVAMREDKLQMEFGREQIYLWF